MKFNENVLNKTRQALYKSGVYYASTDERLYKNLKIGFIIFFIWITLINVTHALSLSMKISGNGGNYVIDDITLASMKNSIPFVIIFTLLLLAAYIFAAVGKHIVATVMGSASCMLLYVHFRNFYNDDILNDGIKSSFYTRHALPIIVIFLITLWMGYIGIKQNVIEKNAYIKFVDGIYEQYKQRQIKLSEQISKEEAFVALSDEEWNKYIEDFSGFEHAKPKRSLKHKFRKEKEQEHKENTEQEKEE